MVVWRVRGERDREDVHGRESWIVVIEGILRVVVVRPGWVVRFDGLVERLGT